MCFGWPYAGARMAGKAKSKMSYSEALAKLQELVVLLERGDMPLEQLEEAVRQADVLLHYCYDKLYGTCGRVEQITASWDKLIRNEE